MKTIIIATVKSWNIKNFYKLKKKYRGKFHFILISSPTEMNIENIQKYNPIYIFFPHWSWKIDKEIYKKYKCIIFHETDLPYGRGGSPLQNLILNKVYKTKISAIECSKNIDAGDIYLQQKINIKEGSIHKIFKKISKKIFFKMIPAFFKKDFIKRAQKGQVVLFKRRKPEQSSLNENIFYTQEDLYDFIRMLDSKEYPKAFLMLNNIKLEFSKVKVKRNKLIGKFEVIDNE